MTVLRDCLSLSISFTTTLTLITGALISYAALLHLRTSPLRRWSYPPGPPETSLILGNASIIPTSKPWITYTEWAKSYGPIFHYRVLNKHMVVLSSIEDCVELLERRSGLYSDRLQLPVVDLMGWDFNAGVMPYGARWRAQRRLLQQAFKRDAIHAYRPNQTRKVNDLLYGLLTSPDDFREHAKTVVAAIIMSTVYGYDISPKGDYFVTLAQDATGRLAQSIFQAVNAIPILRFLPSWFPGAGFNKFAAETKELTTQMKEVPLKYVEDQIASGKMPDCLAAQCLYKCRSKKDYVALQDFASVSYAGGAETVAVAIETFFYAMAISPEIQHKAQQEIDTIIGTGRIPNYDDRSSLPYVEAVYREILRWRPILPLGVPHMVTEDDVYKGYLIPKGAIVYANVWAIVHNTDKYKNPELFNPDRFLDSNGDLNNDDVEYTFGFGRRVCPGRHMASDTFWLTIATILSTFIIRKKRDASGKEIPISGEYSDAAISHPLPYECSIVPRSGESKKVIMEAFSETSKSGSS